MRARPRGWPPCWPRRAWSSHRPGRRGPAADDDLARPGHPDRGGPARAGRAWCRRPRWRSWPRPTSPDAVGPIAPPGPGPGPPTGSSTTWPRATTSVHRQHGVARYAGMVTRTVNGASRGLPAARVPRRRQALPALGSDRRPHPLQRGRVTDAQPARAGRSGSAPGPRPAPRCTRSPRSSSSSTGCGCT